jgi:UDP-galactopyranose mutase
MKDYDVLVVGSGLYGSVYAYLMKQAGKRVLVIDKRSEMGGNIRCENVGGINVHKYGAHIFHTSDRRIWNFVN